MVNLERQRRLIAVCVAGTLWLIGILIGVDPRQRAETRFPIWVPTQSQAPEETVRLLTRWQQEGGLEFPLDDFRALGPQNSLLVPVPQSPISRVDLLYIGELGLDHPLIFATKTFTAPARQAVSFHYFQWILSGSDLVLTSWELGYGILVYLVVTTIVAGITSLATYQWLKKTKPFAVKT